jgi:hypothetical protein
VEVAGCFLDAADARIASGEHRDARFPLTPGRHCSGTVVGAGGEATALIGRPVLVPEVLPCGTCAACRRALVGACPARVRPGLTAPGGLADAVVVPARFVLPLDGSLGWSRPLGEAAAVGRFALPYQALAVAGVAAGDVALPGDDAALACLLRAKGARDPSDDAPAVGWRLFARDGGPVPEHAIVPGAIVVAYGPRAPAPPAAAMRRADGVLRFVSVCHPDLYPEIVALALRGEIDVAGPAVERVPMSRAADGLARCATSPVLVLRD